MKCFSVIGDKIIPYIMCDLSPFPHINVSGIFIPIAWRDTPNIVTQRKLPCYNRGKADRYGEGFCYNCGLSYGKPGGDSVHPDDGFEARGPFIITEADVAKIPDIENPSKLNDLITAPELAHRSNDLLVLWEANSKDFPSSPVFNFSGHAIAQNIQDGRCFGKGTAKAAALFALEPGQEFHLQKEKKDLNVSWDGRDLVLS